LPGYEVLVVLRRAPKRYERLLPAISATWSRLLSTRVALWATLDTELARPPRTQVYFHAGAGQALDLLPDVSRPIGAATFAATEIDPSEVDQTLIEALCALALARLEAPNDRERKLDRVRRAVLACGDASLLVHGLYASTLGERADALHRAGASSALHQAYRALALPVARRLHESPTAADMPDALLRTVTSAVLDLQASRTGCARDLSAFLRSQSRLLEAQETDWFAGARTALYSTGPRVPRASLFSR
jgi:hypothetical protein